MQITVSTRHGRISPGTEEKIAAKVQKLTRFHDRLTAAQVTIDLEHRDSPQLEIRLSAERSDDFVASEKSDGLLTCLDAAVRKLEQQLRRFRERVTDRQHGRRAPRETGSGVDETE